MVLGDLIFRYFWGLGSIDAEEFSWMTRELPSETPRCANGEAADPKSQLWVSSRLTAGYLRRVAEVQVMAWLQLVVSIFSWILQDHMVVFLNRGTP